MSNNVGTPNLKHRSDLIILSEAIECSCGRLKNQAHCPNCGRVKLYAMAETKIVQHENTFVNECMQYRCLGCGTRFNDIDWYFNCHAPKKIDWQATRAKQREDHQKENVQKWMNRIKMGERFDYNDRTKCKAETGWNLNDMITMVREAMKSGKRVTAPTPNQEADFLLDQINETEGHLIDHPDDTEAHQRLKELKGRMTKL